MKHDPLVFVALNRASHVSRDPEAQRMLTLPSTSFRVPVPVI
jgi:hypothetical protein